MNTEMGVGIDVHMDVNMVSGIYVGTIAGMDVHMAAVPMVAAMGVDKEMGRHVCTGVFIGVHMRVGM